MKKIGLGIAILLFCIVLELSMNWNLAYIAWAIGGLGLAFAIAGCVESRDE